MIPLLILYFAAGIGAARHHRTDFTSPQWPTDLTRGLARVVFWPIVAFASWREFCAEWRRRAEMLRGEAAHQAHPHIKAPVAV